MPDAPITSYADAPARSVTTGGISYAYRELGPARGIPVVFFVHLAATLDNWDPRIVDAIAKTRRVITFDNRGVGASSGHVPGTIEEAADDAYDFITALGFTEIDVFSFSMGGMIAQDLAVKHPGLVRKLVLTGTGPRGGKDMDKVALTTCTGAPQPSNLGALTQPTLIANGDHDRMVPSVLSHDLHRRITGSELIIYPNSGHGGILQFHEEFAPVAARFLTL